MIHQNNYIVYLVYSDRSSSQADIDRIICYGPFKYSNALKLRDKLLIEYNNNMINVSVYELLSPDNLPSRLLR